MSQQSLRPENRREFMSRLVLPYDQKSGDPNEIPSQPYKPGQPEQKRSQEISLKKDKDKVFSVGIKDINESIDYYFNNVLKLSVVQNGVNVKVPVIYGSPENWKSIQADGFYRDAKSKLMAPLLVYRRTNLTQNRNLGNKLDGNSVKNIQLFEKRYSKRNAYSNFEVLGNRQEEKEYVVGITPDYVTITYACTVWTYFIEQMDKLIETLNFASRSYWGDPNRFHFLSTIDSFEDQTSITAGEDRLVKTNFTITLNGWLIPDSINKALASINRVHSISKVVFGLETASSSEEFVADRTKPKSKSIANIVAADSQNITINQASDTVSSQGLLYANLNKQVVGTVSSNTTVNFSTGFAVAPTGFPSTSVDNFTFFVNGQLIEKTAIVSFTDNGNNTSTLTINESELGFSLLVADEIIGIGKFA